MLSYILLRIQRIEAFGPSGAEMQIKFFPLFNLDGTEQTILADSPESAFSTLKLRFPILSRFMAIQDEPTYRATVARLSADRILRENADGNSQPQNRKTLPRRTERVFEKSAG
jgi:hypothetical protein